MIYQITLESNEPPIVTVGKTILNGALVTEVKQVKQPLMSAAEIAQEFGITAQTVRVKLALINKGTGGKHLYDIEQARELLTTKTIRRGRKRIN